MTKRAPDCPAAKSEVGSLSDQPKNGLLNVAELQAYAELVAVAWSRDGRNPTKDEVNQMIVTARMMAAAGSATVN